MIEKRNADRLQEDEELPTEAFQLINKMIFEWFRLIYTEEDEVCDSLAANLHKWFVDESSRLYDPLLKRLLQKIVKKIFNYLISQLNNLGAKIIFASTNKLIIDTGKPTKASAENFVNFI